MPYQRTVAGKRTARAAKPLRRRAAWAARCRCAIVGCAVATVPDVEIQSPVVGGRGVAGCSYSFVDEVCDGRGCDVDFLMSKGLRVKGTLSLHFADFSLEWGR